MNLTDVFIEDIYKFSQQELSNATINIVKSRLIDYYGVTIAGSKQTNEKFFEFMSEHGEYLTVDGKMTTFENAIFINAYNSHVLELDDGHRYGMLHLSSPIFSALLVVAQKEKLTFDKFVRAVLVGFETATKLALTIQPSHKLKGYHATGTCGVCGVAMAIATALDFSKAEMKSALSAAATSAGSLLESIEGTSQMKPYNIAISAKNGVTSAYMGKAGFQGPNDILGGKRGFLKVLSDETFIENLRIKENSTVSIEETYTKPYAACRHCHAPIDCAIELKKLHNINHLDIDSVKVYTYKLAILGHEHTKITSVNSAKMSIPYSVAVSLVTSSANMESFEEGNIVREDILSLCDKVNVEEDVKLTELCPTVRGAKMEIIMNDGHVYEFYVGHAKGEPENPMSKEELIDKFMSLIVFSDKSKEYGKQILDVINQLEVKFDFFTSVQERN